MNDHTECAPLLIEEYASLGMQIVVSHEPDPEAERIHRFRCEHGIDLWIYPTADQLDAWEHQHA